MMLYSTKMDFHPIYDVPGDDRDNKVLFRLRLGSVVFVQHTTDDAADTWHLIVSHLGTGWMRSPYLEHLRRL